MEIFTEKRTCDLRVAGSFVVRRRGGSFPGCCSLRVAGRDFLRNELRRAGPRGVGRSSAPLPWGGASLRRSTCDAPARLRQPFLPEKLRGPLLRLLRRQPGTLARG